jgi:hypothetical protein
MIESQAYKNSLSDRETEIIGQGHHYKNERRINPIDFGYELPRSTARSEQDITTVLINSTSIEGFLFHKTKEIIGNYGLARLSMFSENDNGWYFGQGKSLDYSSLIAMNRFIVHAKNLNDPSVFMTIDGQLSLGFSDKGNNSFQLTFLKDEVLILSPDDDEPVKVSIDDAVSFINSL